MLKASGNISKILFMVLGRNTWLIFLLAVSQWLVGVMPALLLYVIGQAVERIIHLQGYSLMIAALGGILLLSEFTEMLERVASSILSDTAQKNLKQMLIDKAASPPHVEHFSNAGFQDVFFLTEKNVNTMSNFIIQSSFLMTGFIGLFSISVLLVSIDWWIPLLLVAGVLPIICFKFQLEKAIWNLEKENANGFKLLTLAYEHLTRNASAKELRLNRCTSLLRGKWNDTYALMLNRICVQRFKGLVKLFLISLPGVMLIVAVLYCIGAESSSKNYGVSQLVILFGAILQIRNQLMIIVANFASISAVYFSANTIEKLLQYDVHATERRLFDAGGVSALSIENVSFKYPGAENWALENISLHIKHHTLTAIIAPNGAGKSTLAHIITGMHRNFTGTITCGVDGATSIWGVNQNFTVPSLTLQEFLDPDGICEQATIQQALTHYQLGHLADKLACYLDSRFENSIALSGGQWQKLALVNVALHFHRYQLIVLDELNAALDGCGDRLYLELLLKMKKTSTVIIISHKTAIHAHCDDVIHLG